MEPIIKEEVCQEALETVKNAYSADNGIGPETKIQLINRCRQAYMGLPEEKRLEMAQALVDSLEEDEFQDLYEIACMTDLVCDAAVNSALSDGFHDAISEILTEYNPPSVVLPGH